jgi:hypothetical protein
MLGKSSGEILMHAQTNQAGVPVQSPPTPKAPQTGPNVNVLSRQDIENLRNQIRQNVRAQLGPNVQPDPDPDVVSAGPHNIVIRGPDGKQTIVSVPSYDAKHLIPPQAVDISVAFFIMIAAIIIGLPVARAFARRMDRGAARSAVSPEISTQLTQLNQAVDAIALEVERISEGQRYTTRLLAEQRDPAHQTLATPADR